MTITQWLQKIYSAVTRDEQTDLQEEQELISIEDILAVQGKKIDRILLILEHQFSTFTVTFKDEQGQELNMPFQLTDSGTGSHLFLSAAETDAAGNPVTID